MPTPDRSRLRTEKSFKEHQEIATYLRGGKAKKAKAVLKRQISRGERSYSDLVGIEYTDNRN